MSAKQLSAGVSRVTLGTMDLKKKCFRAQDIAQRPQCWSRMREVLYLVPSTVCINWAWQHPGQHSGHKGSLTQRPEEVGVLLCHLPPPSFESGSLTEPGARLALSHPDVSLLWCWGLEHPATPSLLKFTYLFVMWARMPTQVPPRMSCGSPAWLAATPACRSPHPDWARHWQHSASLTWPGLTAPVRTV